MKKNVYFGMVALLAVFSLSACGDDSGSSSDSSDFVVREVDKFEDLGKCEKDNFGEIVYVAENDSLYECSGDGWTLTDSSAIEKLLESSDDNSNSSSSFKADSSETANISTVKVENVTLTGFAQKGPFEKGASVTVYGLDSLLEKTKTKFTSKVTNDSGAFKVEKISLNSQYALVEVSGNYTSEVTGKKTSGKSTLKAIMDLSGDKSVKANINIFTELEYARVKYLVTKENFNIPAAKKRATKELLALFAMVKTDSLSISSTDVSLFDTTAAGTALLSASILLQGDLTVAKFGSRLTEIAKFFAESGSLSDKKIRMQLADWASVASSDNYESIRNNLKSLKLTASVPDFGSTLYAFWVNEYGLEPCTDKLEETFKKVENKDSDNYGESYACTSNRWHKSSKLDADLGLCTAKKEGQFEENKSKHKYYACESGSWMEIDDVAFELGLCTENRNAEYAETKDGDYFICNDGEWTEIEALEYELKVCDEKRNGEYAETKDGNYFICNDGEWTEIEALEYELKVCNESSHLELKTTKSSESYVCEWDGKKGEWREAENIEIKFGVCGSKVVPAETFEKDDSEYYMCDGEKWKEIGKLDYELKSICSISNKEARAKTAEKYYICLNVDEGWEWKDVDNPTYEFGFCNTDKEGEKKAKENQYWLCKNSHWVSITAYEYSNDVCTENFYGTLKNGLACDKDEDASSGYSWREQTAEEKATELFCDGNMSATEFYLTIHNGYKCISTGWKEASAAEIATGRVCYRGIEGTIINGYICKISDGTYYWY